MAEQHDDGSRTEWVSLTEWLTMTLAELSRNLPQIGSIVPVTVLRSLKDEEIEVLGILAKVSRPLLTQSAKSKDRDIESRCNLTVRQINAALRVLVARGLVCRNGPRSGYTITDAGRHALAEAC